LTIDIELLDIDYGAHWSTDALGSTLLPTQVCRWAQLWGLRL